MKNILSRYLIPSALIIFFSACGGEKSKDTDTSEKDKKVNIQPIVKKDLAEEAGITFLSIEGGSFEMGSKDKDDDEKEVFTRNVKAFEMSETEITQAQWEKIMETEPKTTPVTPWKKEDGTLKENVKENCYNCPAVYVSWLDANNLVAKLNGCPEIKGNDLNKTLKEQRECTEKKKKTGKRVYDLPTEIQWEYVARDGGSTGDYFWSDLKDKEPKNYAWYDENAGEYAHPVKETKPTNKFKIYDILGNAWEWTRDLYKDTYAGAPQDSEKAVESDDIDADRIARGGGWSSGILGLRATDRSSFKPSPKEDKVHIGLRLVRTGTP